ncbi:unnamed protein product (macronuclear) [Paramecium tetraurelia]|uniref:AB hydrolase-1 domain-containing protein n=1 Tax=Paramecium tetraurelia TaxID=5888 RepID=A0CE56_PARTE|nr:uncharacterized protein GSPATT00037509001 [Paramecium tetraurelia]CAK69073.1 unnamed protein product [Paramecium tetraurelia]|eukprot:XP_001436470.1 hypothetical protein (macronuclear) [Paramecium tetraurelia strain d4-2]
MQSLSKLQQEYHNCLKQILSILRTQSNSQFLLEQILKGNQIEQKYVDYLIINLDAIYNIANKHVQELTGFKKLNRWCTLELFGGLNEFRAMIQLKNQNAKRVMIMNGQSKIDCMYLINQLDGQPNNTVLFCNPNGGYYEYMFYDCNWFRFYEYNKINVIVWNYRQYGQSTGQLHPKALLSDANTIVNYFREHFNIMRFGIQGYSLGGSIAGEVALLNNLDFLIVDRTFSSLGQVASKCFSSRIRMLLNIITDWDKPQYMNYWNYRGHKLIVQDSKDEIIPYVAQLQVAVAREWFSPYKEKYFNKITSALDQESVSFQKFFNSNILNRQQMRILLNSLNRVVSLIVKLNKLEQQLENPQDRTLINININQHLHNQQNYVELITAEELERLQPLLYSMIEIMYSLKYGNTALIELLIYSQDNFEEKVQCFFACCFTFGMHDYQHNFIQQYSIYRQAMTEFLNLQGNQHDWANLKLDGQIILDQFNKIVDRFSEYMDDTQQTYNLNESTERGANIEMKLTSHYITKIGQLINVDCGHNNNLTELDYSQVKAFFRQIGIQ